MYNSTFVSDNEGYPTGTVLILWKKGRTMITISYQTVLILMLIAFIIGVMMGVSLARPNY